MSAFQPSFEIEPRACPNCRVRLEISFGPHAPRPGELALCEHCGVIAVVQSNGSLRRARVNELEDAGLLVRFRRGRKLTLRRERLN